MIYVYVLEIFIRLKTLVIINNVLKQLFLKKIRNYTKMRKLNFYL